MSARLNLTVRCVLDVRHELGESPVWSAREQALYWVDILGRTIHRWRAADAQPQTWTMPSEVGSIGLRSAGGLVVALRHGFHLFDVESGALTPLHDPESEPPTNRFNDGKVSPEGRFWAGTMDDRADKQPVASLYRLDPDHRSHRMASGLKVSNGLAWSPDGRTMYHSDSRAAAVWRYAYDADRGTLGERRLFVAIDPAWGRPDGAAVDMEGCYWSAGVSAGRLNRFSPEGELIGWLDLPVTHPTMPCFGGPELKTLYLTSLREGFTPDALQRTPLAGGLFAIEVDVPGVPGGLYEG